MTPIKAEARAARSMSKATVRQSERVGRETGLKIRWDQRHARRDQREEAERSGEDVEVAGHRWMRWSQSSLRFSGAA